MKYEISKLQLLATRWRPRRYLSCKSKMPWGAYKAHHISYNRDTFKGNIRLVQDMSHISHAKIFC